MIALLSLLLVSPALHAREVVKNDPAVVEKVKSKQAKAIRACEGAMKNSLETTSCIKAGDAFLSKGAVEEAVKFFEKGCALANGEACHRGGEAAKEEGQTARARKLLEQSCKAEWWPGCESLGELEEGAGRLAQAVEAFRAACNHDVSEGNADTRACERFGKAKAAHAAGKKTR